MKNKKKYIFILPSICLTILICSVIFLLRRNPATDENAVSRYEWLEMLEERFGVNEYINETPYFRDVDSGNPYFAYIQSAVEEKVLDVSSDFDGEICIRGIYHSNGNENSRRKQSTDLSKCG